MVCSCIEIYYKHLHERFSSSRMLKERSVRCLPVVAINVLLNRILDRVKFVCNNNCLSLKKLNS